MVINIVALLELIHNYKKYRGGEHEIIFIRKLVY